jgi:hypothetical protein
MPATAVLTVENWKLDHMTRALSATGFRTKLGASWACGCCDMPMVAILVRYSEPGDLVDMAAAIEAGQAAAHMQRPAWVRARQTTDPGLVRPSRPSATAQLAAQVAQLEPAEV